MARARQGSAEVVKRPEPRHSRPAESLTKKPRYQKSNPPSLIYDSTTPQVSSIEIPFFISVNTGASRDTAEMALSSDRPVLLCLRPRAITSATTATNIPIGQTRELSSWFLINAQSTAIL
jgi:hypothetical protein